MIRNSLATRIGGQGRRRMRLAQFIRNNTASIIADWHDFAESLIAGRGMSRPQLEDHVRDILDFMADDLETDQTSAEQRTKSLGQAPADTTGISSAAEVHAALRHADGFDIVEMVSEYRALRASIIGLCVAAC